MPVLKSEDDHPQNGEGNGIKLLPSVLPWPAPRSGLYGLQTFVVSTLIGKVSTLADMIHATQNIRMKATQAGFSLESPPLVFEAVCQPDILQRSGVADMNASLDVD